MPRNENLSNYPELSKIAEKEKNAEDQLKKVEAYLEAIEGLEEPTEHPKTTSYPTEFTLKRFIVQENENAKKKEGVFLSQTIAGIPIAKDAQTLIVAVKESIREQIKHNERQLSQAEYEVQYNVAGRSVENIEATISSTLSSKVYEKHAKAIQNLIERNREPTQYSNLPLGHLLTGIQNEIEKLNPKPSPKPEEPKPSINSRYSM